MKLQIAFDNTDLDKALSIASNVASYADILEVGTLLIYNHGSSAVKQFKEAFPQKIILADAKICDRGKESVNLFALAGADWITVMAGTSKNVIHGACTAAQELGKKIMLDLLDASSLGQSALEAKTLGAHALLFHESADDKTPLLFLDKWEIIKGNTSLPIFISAKIRREIIHDVIHVKPDGIIIGKGITEAENPAQEAQFFKDLLEK
jgi:3-hexulose-6-phosphate synthase